MNISLETNQNFSIICSIFFYDNPFTTTKLRQDFLVSQTQLVICWVLHPFPLFLPLLYTLQTFNKHKQFGHCFYVTKVKGIEFKCLHKYYNRHYC